MALTPDQIAAMQALREPDYPVPEKPTAEAAMVVKGGITSGVVYPLAVCHLATRLQTPRVRHCRHYGALGRSSRRSLIKGLEPDRSDAVWCRRVVFRRSEVVQSRAPYHRVAALHRWFVSNLSASEARRSDPWTSVARQEQTVGHHGPRTT